MKRISVEEFKSQFFKIIEDVKSGEEIEVILEQGKEVIGYFIPKVSKEKSIRQLGVLDGKAQAFFMDDFKMTDEEFLTSK